MTQTKFCSLKQVNIKSKKNLEIVKCFGCLVSFVDLFRELLLIYRLHVCLLFQGFAPRISPFVAVRDLGNLLNRAGFNLLTIVSELCTYSWMFTYRTVAILRWLPLAKSLWSHVVFLDFFTYEVFVFLPFCVVKKKSLHVSIGVF